MSFCWFIKCLFDWSWDPCYNATFPILSLKFALYIDVYRYIDIDIYFESWTRRHSDHLPGTTISEDVQLAKNACLQTRNAYVSVILRRNFSKKSPKAEHFFFKTVLNYLPMLLRMIFDDNDLKIVKYFE